jgi:hypothetical protein
MLLFHEYLSARRVTPPRTANFTTAVPFMNQMNSMRPTAVTSTAGERWLKHIALAPWHDSFVLFSFTLSIMKFSLDHANSRSVQNFRSAPHPLERVDNELTRLTFSKVYHVWAIAPNSIP